MPDNTFIPGQRWISDTEPELGLGSVLASEGRRVRLAFPASGERRVYATDNAPLTRVRFGTGDRIESCHGWDLRVEWVQEEAGLFCYGGQRKDGSPAELVETELSSFLPFNRPQERLLSGQLDDAHWFQLRYATLEQRQSLEQSPLLGLCGGRTALLPHQLYIAHEVSNRFAPRVLLADEVGLGKTIEAGLILHRQMLTGKTSRALILVPAPLLHQWLVELLRRFNLRFSLFDEERCKAADQTINPFQTEQLVLASPELFSNQPERLQQALEAEWDLLIVDEAHHLEWSEQQVSEKYRIVESLSRQIPGVLLLTATPEQLGRAGHFARLRLLDPDRFHNLASFLAEESQFEPIAQAAQQLLTGDSLPSAVAKPLFEALSEPRGISLLRQLEENQDRTDAEQDTVRDQLVELLLDRHGTGRVLFRNTRSRIKGFPERELHTYPLPLPDPYLTCLQDPEVKAIERLAPEALYRGTQGRPWWQFDPRVDWLCNLLQRLKGAKVLLICALAETARELERALREQQGIHAALFHEAMSILERDRAAAWFADPDEGCQILLCSEIGSEGRNFQFAHHLVLFDLPPDPDLLEQRIGRLDRIGQQETVRIHVPYIEQSAQEIMLRWYHEGLNALRNTCPAGHSILSQLQPALWQALEEPDEDPESFAALLQSTQRLYKETSESMQRGRDLLLEINSCRDPAANALKQAIREQQDSQRLPEYMEQMFAAYGVESEEHSAGSLILRPSSRMLLESFPGVPSEGVTCTYHRAIALLHEERQFLSWEHPLVLGAMEMLLDSGQGNSTATALRHRSLKAGSLLLEFLLVLECPAPKRLQAGRFLPPTLIRLLLDQNLAERSQDLSREQLGAAQIPLDRPTARRIITPLRTQIQSMLERGGELAEARCPTLTADALRTMSELYDRETERLITLQRVNPNVRDNEIEALQQQALELKEHIGRARPRLDAVQLIVTL